MIVYLHNVLCHTQHMSNNDHLCWNGHFLNKMFQYFKIHYLFYAHVWKWESSNSWFCLIDTSFDWFYSMYDKSLFSWKEECSHFYFVKHKYLPLSFCTVSPPCLVLYFSSWKWFWTTPSWMSGDQTNGGLSRICGLPPLQTDKYTIW